jgi:Tol biopolymer transport system component
MFFVQCQQNNENSTTENKAENETSVLKGDYLGQTPPGDKPELFAPGIVSSGFNDMDIAISLDLDEIFFARSSPFDFHASIIYLKRENGEWSKPQLAPFVASNYRYGSPYLSPDGKKIYFNTKTPIQGLEEEYVSNIWISERNEEGWGKAIPLSGINTNGMEQYPSVAANGNIYFYARHEENKETDIYCCKFIDNQYSSAEKLGAAINSENSEFHTYVAPDESYLIFDRYLTDGNMDLFISYKKEDGSWTEAVNMGETINDKHKVDIRPYVSPDSKYLFFSSKRSHRKNQSDSLTYSGFMNRINSPGNSSEDIYWVDAKIIEDLKPKDLN